MTLMELRDTPLPFVIVREKKAAFAELVAQLVFESTPGINDAHAILASSDGEGGIAFQYLDENFERIHPHPCVVTKAGFEVIQP